ncbi:MAG: flagellar basal-body MS-ring/collar protein FliF [Candidatus Gastranaerophilales bacterium]|nr:flagellar basal-body MS-ring/collar protein FliF [Candidatus Gastranaerophilales bacterium]
MSNNYFKLLKDDLSRLWKGLDLSKKFGLVVLVVITLVAGSYFLFKSTEPNWTTLYSDLSEQDSVAITESLKKSGYAYKLSKDKKSILVPVEKQDELRLFVAENELIKDSNPGFELLDNMQLGSTDFKNQLTKQRIFQGEITRSIERIQGVTKARVQIAEPERSVFQDKDEIPSASVMLILQPGIKLKTAQVKAIKNLVAYSVPRLTPEKVFITDQSGNSLTDEVEKSSSDIESFRANFENDTAKKVQSVLEKIVGKDNVTVQVSADMDFNSTRSTIESYVPVNENAKEGVLTTEQTETEVYDNPNGAPAQTEGEKAANKNLNYQKQRSSATYSVSKEVKQIVYAPGAVKRMTIAVAVNKILTDEEKTELKNLVMSASGLNADRGDVVNITSLQFASLDEEKAAQTKAQAEYDKAMQQELLYNKILPMIIVLILGGGALAVIGMFIRKMGDATPALENSGNENFLPAYDNPAMPALNNDMTDGLAIEPLPELDVKVDPEFDRIKQELSDSILSDPSEATKILISYIKE